MPLRSIVKRLYMSSTYGGVAKSFRTGRLELELQIVQLSATRCSCIAILWVSLVSFAAITLCVASQRVFIVVSVYFVVTQSGNFWIYPLVLHINETTTAFSRLSFQSRTNSQCHSNRWRAHNHLFVNTLNILHCKQCLLWVWTDLRKKFICKRTVKWEICFHGFEESSRGLLGCDVV
jgi:hypothetical protein